MTNPFAPDYPAGQHGRLVDRASFLGEAGRTGKAQSDPRGAEEFDRLLDHEVTRQEQGRKGDAPHPRDTPDMPEPEIPRRPGLEPASRGPAPADLEARAREQAQREAEHQHTTQARKAPPAPPVPGLPPLLPLSSAALLAGGQRLRRGEEEEEGGSGGLARAARARVDPELVEALRRAGLRQPLLGLDDPRLAGRPDLPADEGWQGSPLAGGGVAFTWESAGLVAYQRLEWDEGRVLLESAAGHRLQTLERQGDQVVQRWDRREVPDEFPPDRWME